MRKLVTVVIHSYNRFDYLSNAINSVLNQTMDDFEIILINDESTDERYYKHSFGKKVKQINIRRNTLPRWTGSRQPLINIGIENANGKYVALLDDDDFWMESKLEKQIAAMEEGYYKFSSTEGYFGLENIQIIKSILYTIENILIRFLKKYRYTKYLKTGKLPEIWNEIF